LTKVNTLYTNISMIGIKILLGDRELGSHTIEKDTVLIGRAPEVDICIPNLSVSRRHGRIFKKNGKWFYEDLCSTNGTYQGVSKVSLCQLSNGTELVIGRCRIIFSESMDKSVGSKSPYAIDIRKILEEEEDEHSKSQIDSTIKFDKTAVIKIQPRQDGNGDKKGRAVAYLECSDTKDKVDIEEGEIFIGKDEGCRVRINGLLIGSRHAKISYDGQNIIITALKSFPAVSVNGVKITERVLKNDDYIDIGSYRFRIRFYK